MGKLHLFCIILSTTFLYTYSQDADSYYQLGVDKMQSKQLDEAIEQFSKCIKLQPENYYAYFNSGVCKNRLKKFDEAILDFNQAIKIEPNFKNSYVSRSNAHRHLKNLSASLKDCNIALSLDSNYPEAYYNRALLFEMYNKKDSACLDFNKALQLGLPNAKNKADSCNGFSNKPVISSLKENLKDKDYGFTSTNPIKVGTGPKGGPANQRAYLDLLLDKKGNPVTYERIASCCPYESKNNAFGFAMLDQYKITFQNEKGKKKTLTVYISFYDFEEPMVLFGFDTIK